MPRSDSTTTVFECDWNCGETVEFENLKTIPRQLNHAGVPEGWEVLRHDMSAVMTTNEYKAPPIMLCPGCWGIFKLLRDSYTTPRGSRLRAFIDAYMQNEEEINRIADQYKGSLP
ncbi:gp98 [Mycobacterium phage Barnyard]|uniref:Uncharacterized protein n=1 Tax=Mycobacterium phage Barnyard TaxID=205880 RepID=Q855X4_9CAUD|nr:gp98 [Mycobacterium phage Barnyard]AAN02152.1 hypothetical protein PBI_BARNYARD_98 [Mycobacterium phage Barnyard]